MHHQTAATAAAAAILVGSFSACSSDETDRNVDMGDAGGTGASGGSDAKADSSGSATGDASAGSPSDGGDPTTTCVASQPTAFATECAECRCDTCLAEWEACAADSACVEALECAAENACTGNDCYLPETCQAVFDAAGGFFSPPIVKLTTLGSCAAPCNQACGGATEGEPIPASVTVSDSSGPLEGAEVCVLDYNSCATTDASGVARLDAPALSEVAYVVDASEHMPRVHGTVSGPFRERVSITLRTTAEVEAMAADAGVTIDDTRGIVSVGVVNGLGVRPRLIPDSGILVFLDENGDPDPSLNAAVDGVDPEAFFWNVAPGDYQVAYSHPDTTCRAPAAQNWEGDTEDTTRVTVLAGHLSYGAHYGVCEPIP